MNKRYEKSMKTENNIYKEMKDKLTVPSGVSTGWEKLDKALDWLCSGSESILDFGCGKGSMIFLCANRGTKNHVGIDLAAEGINCAKLRSDMMEKGEFEFYVGSLEQLQKLKDKSFDGIILSNIIDNMYPNDARAVLLECSRILKSNGKLLIKLNPYVTKEQVKEWKLNKLEEDVYDDGLILWNRATNEWEKELMEHFTIIENTEFYIPEAEQVNRLFLLLNH